MEFPCCSPSRLERASTTSSLTIHRSWTVPISSHLWELLLKSVFFYITLRFNCWSIALSAKFCQIKSRHPPISFRFPRSQICIAEQSTTSGQGWCSARPAAWVNEIQLTFFFHKATTQWLNWAVMCRYILERWNVVPALFADTAVFFLLASKHISKRIFLKANWTNASSMTTSEFDDIFRKWSPNIHKKACKISGWYLQ